MSNFICLDSSVLVKLLTWEDGSEAAAELMEKIVEDGCPVVLPAFAWAEVGSVLRQKARRMVITPEEAEEAWRMFWRLKVITYLENEEVPQVAWNIAAEEDLSTLYDAAYLAVAEVAAKSSQEGACEFWTADEKLVSALRGRKEYIRLLEK